MNPEQSTFIGNTRLETKGRKYWPGRKKPTESKSEDDFLNDIYKELFCNEDNPVSILVPCAYCDLQYRPPWNGEHGMTCMGAPFEAWKELGIGDTEEEYEQHKHDLISNLINEYENGQNK